MKVDVGYLQFRWWMRYFPIACGEKKEKSNLTTVSFCVPV
jgi:hypothetical protein